MADDPAENPAPPRDYDLVHGEGSTPRFVLRYRDTGLRLAADGLEWTTDGQPRRSTFAEISRIRLQTGTVGRGSYFGTCTITFRSGDVLFTAGVTPWGHSDSERATAYAAFVRDLHARLGPEDRKRIAFVGGNTQGRQTFAMTIMVIALAFFVGLPVVLLIITGEVKALFIAFTGAFLVAPFLKQIRANAPATYSPGAIPEDLLP